MDNLTQLERDIADTCTRLLFWLDEYRRIKLGCNRYAPYEICTMLDALQHELDDLDKQHKESQS